MKKFFLFSGVFVFLAFLSGCSFWWGSEFANVVEVDMYLYNQDFGFELPVNVELVITPDHEKRTFALAVRRYADGDKQNPGLQETDNGVVGGSNYDDFEQLLGLLEEIEAEEVVSDLMLSVAVVDKNRVKTRYDWDSKLDENGQRFYDFYTTMEGMFSEDVY